MARTLDQLDTDLGVIEALLEDAPVQGMDEMSFPIAEKALNSLQWQAVSVATGSGIADRGGQPFWLRDLSNTTDSARLTVSATTKTAEASIMGFFFQMKKDVQVPLPPVTSTTTYHIGLEFDPTRLKDEAGPIRRVVHKNTIPYVGGKIYLPLWEVTRKPNQLLSDATVAQKRPKISPQINVDYEASKPDPRTQLWGTRLTLTHGNDRGREFIAWGASEETGGPTEWAPANGLVWHDLNLAGTRRYPGHGLRPQYAVTPQGVVFRGRVARDSGDFTTSSDGWTLGRVNTVYEDRPFTVFQPVAGSGTTNPSFGKVTNENATLLLFPQQTMGWADLGGVVGYWT